MPVVAQQGVERAEAVEPGHGGAHQPLAGGVARQWRDAAQVRAHDVGGVAVVALGSPAELGDEVLVEARCRRSRRPSQPRGRTAGAAGR